MWNKKNEEAPTPRAAAPQPDSATPTPVRPAYTAPPEPAKAISRGGTIGASMTVKGEVYSREELNVDGEIQGSIELHHRLTVGPNGKIRANVKAKEVVVQGSIQGNVQSAEKIIIREKGSLVGDIKTAGIVIEDGAYFKGSIDITKADTSAQKPAAAPAQGQPQAQAVAQVAGKAS